MCVCVCVYVSCSDVIVVESENSVFLAILSWLKRHKADVSDEQEEELFSVVRYGLCGRNFFIDVVWKTLKTHRSRRIQEMVQEEVKKCLMSPMRRSMLLLPGCKPRFQPLTAPPRPTIRWTVPKEQIIDSKADCKSALIWCNGYQFRGYYDREVLWLGTCENVVLRAEFGWINPRDQKKQQLQVDTKSILVSLWRVIRLDWPAQDLTFDRRPDLVAADGSITLYITLLEVDEGPIYKMATT